MKNCKMHNPVIHECIEMIAYGHKYGYRPINKGNIKLSCETVDLIIAKLPKCNCRESYIVPGPLLSPDWGLFGEAGIECKRCNRFYNREIENILKIGRIKITEIDVEKK